MKSKKRTGNGNRRKKRFTSRVKVAMKVLGDVLDDYERNNPSWYTDTILELIKSGLKSLAIYIRRGSGGISWRQPLVELQYQVNWNWEAWEKGDKRALTRTYGTLTNKILKSAKKTTAALANIAIETRNQHVLDSLTRNVGYEITRDVYTPLIPTPILRALKRLPPKKRRAEIKRLYSPLTIGTLPRDIQRHNLVHCGPISVDLLNRIVRSFGNVKTGPIPTFEVINGQPLLTLAYTQFEHLVVDVDNKRAYFPIVIGVTIHPVLGVDGRTPARNSRLRRIAPERWSRKTENKLWASVYKTIDVLKSPGDEGVPPTPPSQIRPLDIMLKARVVPHDDKARTTVVNRLAEVVGEHAEIQSFVVHLGKRTGRKRRLRRTRKVRILLLLADPSVADRLRLDLEVRTIADKVGISKYGDELDFKYKWAARADDVLQGLNEHRPDLVHFSGHGSSSTLVFVDMDGRSHKVPKEAIAHMFRLIGADVRVAVFNSCDSSAFAKAVTRHIDCAIGMNSSISDRAATIFAASFYRAIAFGNSIENSFRQGTSALLLEGIAESTIPRLHVKKDVDASQVVLLRRHS